MKKMPQWMGQKAKGENMPKGKDSYGKGEKMDMKKAPAKKKKK